MPNLTVLVPLDGSQVAESALDHLAYLQPLGALKVKLISVWEEFERDETKLRDVVERRKRGAALLKSYLHEVSQRVPLDDLDTVAIVRNGDVATRIIREANQADTDVVLISTHGRSGLELFRLGSVADKVIRGTAKPILIARPDERHVAPKSIIVPLDGSDLAEEALPVASMLADAYGASLHIARVVTNPVLVGEPTMEMYTPDVFESLEEAAREYLNGVAVRLPEVPTTQLLFGQPAPALREYISRTEAPLVVVTSHGRHGVIRWALGSVAEQLIKGTAPVLLLRSAGQGGDRSELVRAAQRYAQTPAFVT
jgi:nucleotide-binding universal stress UspA family protein